ncbi:MAG TPA: GNAT family N-acetyltransferase [Mycobacteriales bacterium]|nr:GNAT family N-acetyltransferase [Mycobacteriales bacterium]
MTSGLDLREEPYDGPAAQALIAAVQQEYVVRYGGPDESPVEPGEFAPPAGRFLVGYIGTEPVATGGIRRRGDGTVEIKRMYVAPVWRGRGLSREVLAALEDLARLLGASRVVLETGVRQPEAMHLYETSGYQRIEGFGHYCGTELSVSYGKTL